MCILIGYEQRLASFLHSAADNPTKACNKIVDLAAELARKDDEDDTQQASVVSKRIDEIDVYSVSGIEAYWAVAEDWIVVSNSPEHSRRMVDLVFDKAVIENNAHRSRKLQTLDANISRMGKRSASINVFVQPKLLIKLGWLSKKWYRVLEMDELLGIGASLSFVTQDDASSRQVAINGFVLASVPRVGLADAISFAGPIDSFPPLPEGTYCLAACNIDVRRYWTVLEEAFGQVNEEKDFLSFFVKNERVADLLGPEFVENSVVSRVETGPKFGYAYYNHKDTKNGRILAFSQVDNVEVQRSALSKARRDLDRISGRMFGYEEANVLGYPAIVTTNRKHFKQPRGFVWFEDWMFEGDIAEIEKVVGRFPNTNGVLGTELDAKVSVLRRRFAHANEPSALVALWPKYWLVWIDGMLSKYALKKANIDFSDQDAIERTTRIRNLSISELDAPSSGQDSAEIALLYAFKAIAESLGTLVFIASEDTYGFKLSGMTFSMDDIDN